jgi:mRNA interferase RelE/StbE
MPHYEIRFSKEAVKDIKALTPRLKDKLKDILERRLRPEPYSGKKLIGYLQGFFSIRLTYKDRIVYSIDEDHKIIYIHRAKTHYGD